LSINQTICVPNRRGRALKPVIKVQFYLRADIATRPRDISSPVGKPLRESTPSRLAGGEPFIGEIRIQTHLGSYEHTKPRDGV
jgi:hypothetical protein